MNGELYMDIRPHVIEVKIHPKMTYAPMALEIKADGFRLEIQADEDQLAEIEYAIRQYLERIRYYETPDQQEILNAEYDETAERSVVW